MIMMANSQWSHWHSSGIGKRQSNTSRTAFEYLSNGSQKWVKMRERNNGRTAVKYLSDRGQILVKRQSNASRTAFEYLSNGSQKWVKMRERNNGRTAVKYLSNRGQILVKRQSNTSRTACSDYYFRFGESCVQTIQQPKTENENLLFEMRRSQPNIAYSGPSGIRRMQVLSYACPPHASVTLRKSGLRRHWPQCVLRGICLSHPQRQSRPLLKGSIEIQ